LTGNEPALLALFIGMQDTMSTRIHTELASMATSIRLAPETEKRLDALAARTGRTKAYYLREIIDRGLEDMEDYYLAADVLERVRQGREAVFTLDDVEHELGLAD
jgi:RHH-type rel operon transcriptional repressor/antitoxin RelB